MAAAQNFFPPRDPATVVVADVSRMDCQLLVDAIERHKDFKVLNSAISSSQAIAVVRENQPDLVVLSTQLQDGVRSGLLVLQSLRTLELPSRVVVLLDSEDQDLVVEVFRQGARGVFCRTEGSAELRKCMQFVCNGKIWASKAQWEWIVAALAKAPSAKPGLGQMTKALSKREEEIARLVAAALSNRELSRQLGISEHTVKNYLSRIFEKLGIATRTELVLHVLSQAKPTAAQKSQQFSRSIRERTA